MAEKLKIELELNSDSDPVLVAQIIEMVRLANGVISDPSEPTEPTDPPIEEEFFWDNNHTMDQAVPEVSGLPVAYLKVKGGAFLWKPNQNNVLEASQPVEFSTDTNTARTKFKPEQIIVVVKDPKYKKPGATEFDEKIFNKDGLEHIQNIGSPQRPFPIAFDSGTRGFIVMWEQRIDGRDLREHPDRFGPLVVRAEDVIAVMEY